MCPETVEELDAFRLEHADDTIWCGTKFEGGCGRRLTTRRYTEKICHFAHYGTDGTGEQCARTAKGKDSANHLFAKAHLASWLRTQGVTAEFVYLEPLGSAVRAELDDGRTFLVHLDRNRPVVWDDDSWELVLGPGVPVVTDILKRRGYVHRIRFEDRPGGGRLMRFGTELPGQGTTWENLDAVTLTSQGVNTVIRPAAVRVPLAELPRQATADQRTSASVARTQLLAVTAARQNDPVKRALLHLDRALRDQQEQIPVAINAIRQLLETTQTPENVGRLRIALSRVHAWTDQRARHRKEVVGQLKERAAYGLLLEATELLKDRDATAEERETVRLAWQRYDEEQAANQRAQAEKREARQRQREAERQQREAEQRQREVERHARAEHAVNERRRLTEAAERQAQADMVAYLAPFLFGALKKAAREGRTTTWEEVGEKTGQRQLGRLSHQDRLDLLKAIEKKTLPGKPLWSAVLSAAGTSDALRLHRGISDLLQRSVPDNDSDLLTQLTADCAQLRRQ
ncbi:hypothetical protein ACODT5_03345 [Streptomyces sp. 5.8]|uniref:hypothetical protein n=1 Tax=Streptomyces sp. 5.8 TaxID=3406571 RepID=UPI003BB70DB2